MTLAHAKTHLSHVLDRIEQGEEVVITRRGHPVARIAPLVAQKLPVASLKAFRAGMPRLRKPGAALLREMRDTEL